MGKRGPKPKGPANIIPFRGPTAMVCADDVGFTPSQRMLDARSLVRELVDSGLPSPADWLPELRKRAGNGEPALTSDEWRDWQGEEGFIQWWYRDLYPKPTRERLLGYIMAWETGLRARLVAGEPRITIWFYETIIASGGQDASVLSEILAGKPNNPWKSGDTSEYESDEEGT